MCLKFDEHSSPIFKETTILKLLDLVNFHASIFMFKFDNKLLPAVFDIFSVPTYKVYNYNTKLSSSIVYSLPIVRTNYRKFNIRFSVAKNMESSKADLKLVSIGAFKARLKSNYISRYKTSNTVSILFNFVSFTSTI